MNRGLDAPRVVAPPNTERIMSRRARTATTAVVAPSVRAGLASFCDGNESTVRQMTDAGAGDDLVEKLLGVMGVSKISAEQLLANYFSAGVLGAYARRIGKSDKGGQATLAERIAREWAKPSFEPPASRKRPAEEEPAEDPAAKRLAALEEIKAKRAAQAARAAQQAAPPAAAPTAPTVDAATVDLKPLFSAVIAELGVDDLSAKVLREKVEAKLGLAAGALKPRREEIKAIVEEIISEHEAVAKERKAAMRREIDAGLQASAATGVPAAPSAVKEWAQGGLRDLAALADAPLSAEAERVAEQARAFLMKAPAPAPQP